MASAPPRRQSIFRPCIDLHDGQVKQIVGGTLSDIAPETLKTNFVAKSVLLAQIAQKLTMAQTIRGRLCPNV